MRFKKVREIMTRGIITVGFEAPILDVIKTMVKNDVTCVVAVSTNGEAMGVISSTDIIKTLKNMSTEKIKPLKAEDVMTPFTIQIQPDDTIENAIKLMVEKNVHRLVVLSPQFTGRKPVGILSSTDLVREIYKDLAR
ncbi:MAG: CBS domain-containing protein [Euryarchaeota archaeon]|nr:CBS domain-containing protein [Euryarchaeota archaeon]